MFREQVVVFKLLVAQAVIVASVDAGELKMARFFPDLRHAGREVIQGEF